MSTTVSPERRTVPGKQKLNKYLFEVPVEVISIWELVTCEGGKDGWKIPRKVSGFHACG